MIPGRRESLGVGLVLVVAAVLAAGPSPARASVSISTILAAQSIGQLQVQLRGGFGPILVQSEDPNQNKNLAAPNVFPQPDRAVLRQMSQARQLIEKERYGEAVRFLGEILESSEDYFFQPDPTKSAHVSLKAEAQRLIGQMPSKGRELYELQFGARAKQTLAEAIREGDAQRLAEVSRRFFHTQAGYEATFLLGVHHHDVGQPLAAALTFQRLRSESGPAERFEPALSLALATCWVQAGLGEKAEAVLDDLSRRRPDAQIWIAGKKIRLPEASANALEWLAAQTGVSSQPPAVHPEDWIMPGGSASRTAAVTASRPLLNLVWQAPASEHPLASAILRQRTRLDAERNSILMPEVRPLAVGNVVLTRSLRGLVAIDFTTGKRLWEAPTDDLLDNSHSALRSVYTQPGQLESMICHRVWSDRIFGELSSDGELVFAVEDLGLGTTRQAAQTVFIQGRRVENPAWPSEYNRLAAYSIRTGKLVWHLGGGEEFGLPEANSFFLGPPLPLMGRLYQLAETGGEIRLLALEASTGKRLWSQQIAVPEQDISQDGLRRQYAVTPSYADGILVCPTTNGAIVAVELASRSLLWGYRYGFEDEMNGRHMRRRFIGSMSYGNMPGTWIGDDVYLCNGRVLTASGDSQHLHCLRLVDGELLWKIPSQGDLFVACVHDDVVVLVGQRQIRAVNLSNGLNAWGGRAIPLPGESMPSGRGVATDDTYYLPLNSSNVVSIDLKNGAIRHLARSRNGHVAGNLIAHRGKILSQSATGLEAFHQLDTLKDHVDSALIKKPQDAETLTLHAEILLDEGKREEALADLRRAYATDPRVRTRELLRETLLAGLADDFVTYRNAVDEIKPLLDGPVQQMTFLRLMADGLETQEEWDDALTHYLQLIDWSDKYPGLMNVSKDLSVHPDRWLQARLATLRQAAPPEVVEKLDQVARKLLAEAIHEEKTSRLERFLAVFGSHPLAAQAAQALVERYEKDGRLLAAERLLRWNEGTCDRTTSPATLVELANLYRRARKQTDATACYRELAQKYADTVCYQGKTGSQLVEELPADDPVRIGLAETPWPTGHVETTTRSSTNRSYRYGNYSIPFRGEAGPFFDGQNAQYQSSQRQLAMVDSSGRERWRVSISPTNNQSGYSSYHSNMAHLLASGHLLLMTTGTQYHALDTSAPGKNPRLLWSQDFSNIVEPDPEGPSLPPGTMNWLSRQWGIGYDYPPLLSRGALQSRFEGLAAVFSPRFFCYAHFRRCVAIDPLTGETLWVRRGLPRGSILLGDAKHIYLLPPDRGPDGSHKAIVLRALDGEQFAARRSVPGMEHWMAYGDGKVLIRKSTGSEYHLEMFDIWEQRVTWKSDSFHGNSQVAALNGVVGIVEPAGRFCLLQMSDGKKLFHDKLHVEPNLQEIMLLESGDQYVLVVQSQYRHGGIHLGSLQGVRSYPVREGRLYAFDRNGKKLWPDYPQGVPVTNQQIILDQPSGLPVIAFGSQIYNPNEKGSQQWRTAILMLDRRTGRKIIDEKLTNQAHFFSMSGDATNKTIHLDLYRTVMDLKFTSNPIPPEPEKQTPDTKKNDGTKPKAIRGLLDALRFSVG
ncbi:MAG: PQQ-binding-like beta-propeller repeat protein [Pirellulales bacterium]|nr:PQQ-binding-like beta-propeller repeat protein [Pirellulales bacterium]